MSKAATRSWEIWNGRVFPKSDPQETIAYVHDGDSARLIAAAPELLDQAEENSAILLALLTKLDGVVNEKVSASIRERIAANVAAIAKATGAQ